MMKNKNKMKINIVKIKKIIISLLNNSRIIKIMNRNLRMNNLLKMNKIVKFNKKMII